MKLTLLPSDKGDCLLLESTDGTAILIDGGMRGSYVRHIRPFLGKWRKANNRPLNLVYLSHIDEDHIAGVLQLMDDLVAWRVFRHKQKSGEQWKEPDFAEPPEVNGLWHNSFHDIVGDNAGAIGSMLAARATQLSNSDDLDIQRLADHYQAIAASIPEAIKLSGRVSPEQLGIPLNKEFAKKLAMVRTPAKSVVINGSKSPLIWVLGPFEEDLKKFRTKWNQWLKNKENQAKLKQTRDWRDREDQRLDFSAAIALDADELGNRAKVTEENLASLMLLVEQSGRRNFADRRRPLHRHCQGTQAQHDHRTRQ